ncbi:cell wall metabolism sensor histidine kinase WalK [Paenibacillus sp. NEAU-GSW1]|uniref:sensor histidine kinase n=1 Tax=Paenibacillus sp. NEAU-GSW1 TaxID=2682486 RepID=UPI0012E29F07|nr:HAMP domain-containing sensor histidine kinase [Paenibacillus sp. NEAU-GSW1]MUT66442.1 HAMP domain-containing protein [Paenibacillus sp. NEAU-GSW1]
MSIRRKLYLSYMLMTVAPFIAVVGLMLFIIHVSGIEDVRNFFKDGGKINYAQSFVAGEMNNELQSDPGRIENEDARKQWDDKLAELMAGFVLYKDGKADYVSSYLHRFSPNEKWEKFYRSDPGDIALNQYSFRMFALDFVYEDGSAGKSVIMLRAEAVPMYWKPIFTLFSLIIIGLTGVLLTYFVSRSIIRPLQSLKIAANYMKEGDLSHPVEAKAKGEIGELSTAFEEMRVRLKQSIDQSLQYEENRKMLLSHISHDLKTPISAIKGYVEGLADGIANTDEKRERYMRTIYRKASDMDRLIDELFLFSKLDLQKVAFDFKVIDLRKYLLHFLEEQRFDAEKADIALQSDEIAADASPIYIAADLEKLGRAIGNMMNNCMKYMRQSNGHSETACKRISVRLNAYAKEAIIIIEDTGPGIEPADLPYIFDGFYRAEQSRNSETGGSGLGLAIVKQIIEGHGGRVWAENAKPCGSRFYVSLPVSLQPLKAVKDDEKNTDH